MAREQACLLNYLDLLLQEPDVVNCLLKHCADVNLQKCVSWQLANTSTGNYFGSTGHKTINYFGSIGHQLLQNLEPLIDPFPSSLQSERIL
jgi:hypothetical protein